MDYDAVIGSAETTIGMVEAIRRSVADEALNLQHYGVLWHTNTMVHNSALWHVLTLWEPS